MILYSSTERRMTEVYRDKSECRKLLGYRTNMGSFYTVFVFFNNEYT